MMALFPQIYELVMRGILLLIIECVLFALVPLLGGKLSLFSLTGFFLGTTIGSFALHLDFQLYVLQWITGIIAFCLIRFGVTHSEKEPPVIPW